MVMAAGYEVADGVSRDGEPGFTIWITTEETVEGAECRGREMTRPLHVEKLFVLGSHSLDNICATDDSEKLTRLRVYNGHALDSLLHQQLSDFFDGFVGTDSNYRAFHDSPNLGVGPGGEDIGLCYDADHILVCVQDRGAADVLLGEQGLKLFDCIRGCNRHNALRHDVLGL